MRACWAVTRGRLMAVFFAVRLLFFFLLVFLCPVGSFFESTKISYHFASNSQNCGSSVQY